MERQSVKADDLAFKVNYIRDWLNKAEEAIRRGDTIDAVAKLSLAKADTTNIISNLMPQPSAATRAGRTPSYAVALRKLALMSAPFLLIACFLVGMVVGNAGRVAINGPSLNNPINGELNRTMQRPSINTQLLALAPNPWGHTADVAETPVETTIARPPVKQRVTSSHPAGVVATSVAPSPGGDLAVDAVPPPDESASADEPLDLFDFGLDVIRSARENMGR